MSKRKSPRHQAAAYVKHAKYDGREETAAAREAAERRYYEETDPSLPHEERLRRAAMLRKAFYARLTDAGVRARKKKATRRMAAA